LPITQNQALFSILSTTYGGDGRVNFALPDLRGKIPIHVGQGFTEGQAGGEVAHTLNMSEMPAHNHLVQGLTDNANVAVATNAYFASTNNLYTTAANLATINPDSLTNFGGSQPHNNLQPYLVLNFIIALQGIFPSRN
jgi:microcystin-dependent protein